MCVVAWLILEAFPKNLVTFVDLVAFVDLVTFVLLVVNLEI